VEILSGLIRKLRETCAGLPDRRTGKNVVYTMADAAMAAFSVFFMQSPSFLAHQKRLAEGHGRSNCQSLFEMDRIPCDNHIRALLDPVEPQHFFPVFDAAFGALRDHGGLDAFRRLDGRVLIAFDGTEYFRSNEISCTNCSTREHAGGKTEYFHALVSATLVAPGHNHVVCLPPEFVVPQDGAAKQDCESRAARRWLTTHGPRFASLDPVYLGDDLYSRQPLCAAVRAAGGHFLFVCKPASHKTLFEYLNGIELARRVVPVRRGKKRFTHTYRWLEGVPLRDGADAMTVNWFAIEIADASGKITYQNSFVTDLCVDAGNVADLVAAGRARWKIENGSFNVLKTKGYNLEHNFGHGKENLAAVLATLNLLAFTFHTLAELTEPLWRKARGISSSRVAFFDRVRSVVELAVFASWRGLFQVLTYEVRLAAQSP
jgi:hypothetical protein